MAIFNLTHQTGQITDEHLTSGLGLPLEGVLSEYRCFPAYRLVRIPDYLSDEEGSTLPVAAATAWMAINWMRPIGQPVQGASQIVLLQGTGGVSIAGLQIAKASGLTGKPPARGDMSLTHSIDSDRNVVFRRETAEG